MCVCKCTHAHTHAFLFSLHDAERWPAAAFFSEEMVPFVIQLTNNGCLFSLPNGKKKKEKKAYSTWYSQSVSRTSTNQARRGLASEIGRDRACSAWYGRKRRKKLLVGLIYRR